MKRVKKALLAVLPMAALTLTGCQVPQPAPGTISVVVGLYPYAYLAQAIGQDHVTVTNLTQPGAEPHDLELTAMQVAQVATSSLTIYEAGLQPAVDAAVKQAKPNTSLDVTSVVPLESHGTGADDPSNGSLDPHIWLDPTHMVTIAQAIADILIRIDPANQSTYTQGLATLTATLTTIDTAYTQGLSSCQRTEFLTTHAAFGYLAERYDLTQISISGLSPDAEPSPDRIAEIHQIAQEKGLTTVFFETLTSPDLAKTIASDMGLATDVLDPIEGLTKDSRGEDYAAIMSSNLTALRTANGCS
ncbi:MAG: metal ABC transporter substrate-binding protein [Propionibacteriaceae bacterium]|nr:metal ABC transporter substrate-binding protein [Propionibacteriaceae bacterium]